MFKNVVVGTDGSATASKAAEVAARLAKDWDATLHIVVAYKSDISGMAAASGAAMVDPGLHQGAQREVALQVAAKAAESWAQGVKVEPHAVQDSPPDAILDTAKSVGADLIIVGSKGMRGARRVLGSVPNSVAHGAECAVLIVKTD
jgi:nucleotide-binding universal stress UspA family protein